MHTVEECRRFVAECKYKPGITIRPRHVLSYDDDILVVEIGGSVQDTYQPEKKLDLYTGCFVRISDGPEAWARQLWNMLQERELHEAGEWFKTPEGERPFDPHNHRREWQNTTNWEPEVVT